MLKLENVRSAIDILRISARFRRFATWVSAWRLPKALDAGDTYQSAIEKTGVSTATIGRVKRCLNYGAGGYRLVLDRMKSEEKRP